MVEYAIQYISSVTRKGPIRECWGGTLGEAARMLPQDAIPLAWQKRLLKYCPLESRYKIVWGGQWHKWKTRPRRPR